MSDYKKVVDDIKRGSSAEHAAIIHEITDRSRLFIACNIIHEFRSSNTEAHNIAKHALTVDSVVMFGSGNLVIFFSCM